MGKYTSLARKSGETEPQEKRLPKGRNNTYKHSIVVDTSSNSVTPLSEGSTNLRTTNLTNLTADKSSPLCAVLATCVERPVTPHAKCAVCWASELCRAALARLATYYSQLSEDERERLDLSGQDLYHARMDAAGAMDDAVAFRAALAQWERAGLRAFEDARSKKGAACHSSDWSRASSSALDLFHLARAAQA
jgi:hypothetical protein